MLLPDRAEAGLASAAGDGPGLKLETGKLDGVLRHFSNVFSIGRACGAALRRAGCSVAAIARQSFAGAGNEAGTSGH